MNDCKNFVDELNSNFLNNCKDVNTKLLDLSEEHHKFVGEMVETNEKVSESFNLFRNEINDLSDRQQKLKNSFDAHKNHTEIVNRHNAEQHEKIECSMQNLFESKNSMMKDIDHIKSDVKLNENSRKNQDKLHTDYIEAMNANQKYNTEALSKVETDLRSMEEKMKLEKRNVRDEFRKTEIRFDDTDSDIKSKMKSFKDQIDIDQESLHEQVFFP